MILCGKYTIIFRNRELFADGRITVRNAVDEKKIFCELCGESDIQKLNHQIPMTYDDFERITYILDVLNLHCYEVDFWDTFQGQFEHELAELEMEYFDMDTEVKRYTKWLLKFSEQISDPSLKHLAKCVFDLDID